MMIDYKKAEQAKELIQECGASFIIAYNNSNNDGSSNNAGSNADATDTTIKAPKTGDTSNDALWVVLLAVASVAGLSGFAEILVRRKKSDCK